jgi:DNA-binding Xre family transcriptional regulator
MEKELNSALWERIHKVGSELKLSKIAGVTQANLNKIKNNYVSVDNIRLGTLRKIFPNMQIDFLGTGGKKGIEGRLAGMINRLSSEQRADLALAIADKYKGTVEERLD